MKCPICGQKLEAIVPAHVRKHDLTMQEFLEKYPEFKNRTLNARFAYKFDASPEIFRG